MLKTNRQGGIFSKFFAAVCTLCLTASLGAVTAGAAGSGKVSVSSGTAERGGTVSVSVNMAENPGISEMKLRLHYDSSALTLEAVSTGTVFESKELTPSQNLSKNPYVIVCSSGDMINKLNNLKTGNIITMNFKVKENVEYKSYAVTADVDAINIEGKKCSFTADNGSVNVVKCIHSKEWRVTTAATCEKDGTETLTCTKCSEAFETRTISAYKHRNTEVRNAKAATKKSEGYTGDTYCKDCGKLISKGKATEKLKSDVSSDKSSSSSVSASSKPDKTESTKSENNKYTIITGKNSVFGKNSKKPLTFASDADFSEFIRVEIDGKTVEKTNYTAESGSTVITLSADFLSTLTKGRHTISIVSKSGTADTEFTVEETADTQSDKSLSTADAPASKEEAKSSKASVIIITAALILAAGAVGALYFFKQRRG